MDCPDDDTLALLLGGELSDDEPLHDHLDRCPRCAATMVELAALFHDDEDDPEDGPSEGATIGGRYRLEQMLGRGGMGVVHLARDLELDREVAVKLVRPEVAAEYGDALQARLHKEARAMARVNDPAVVPVLDVGRDADTVYVVMERVDGVTLRTWLKTGQRTRDEILAAVVAAGRGLWAAHQAGLVHRDFKPDNVMVGRDGRVRVTDFGMAIVPEANTSLPSSIERMPGSEPVSGSSATHTGTVMGTPAYMAPEQIDGRPLDARSDQYAWCLVLVEALSGRRPFEGRSLSALREAQRKEPTLSDLPASVRAVARRGLREDPSLRWPTLEQALAAVRRSSRPRWRWAAGLGLVLLPGAATSAVTPDVSRCQAGAVALQGTWSEALERRGASTEAGRPVRAALEEHVDALTAAYHRSCGSVPAAVVAADVQDCLDRRRARLGPVLERWAAEADADLLDVVTGLPGPDSCFGVDEERPLPSDAARAEQVRGLRTELEQAWGHFMLGETDRAEARLDELQPRIESLGYEPLQAEWGFLSGRVLLRGADAEAAQARLEQSYWLAHRAGDDWIAARSATELFRMIGDTLNRFEEADRWARHAESSLERADRVLGWYHFHGGRMAVELRRREPEQAREHAERALELAQRLWPPGHHDTVGALVNLATVDTMQGRLPVAEGRLRRAIEAREGLRGEDYPDLAPMLHTLAEVVSRQGRSDEAERLLLRSMQIARDAHGPEHPLVSDARNGLAIVAAMRGDFDRAEALFVEDLEYTRRRFGAQDERTMIVRGNLANVRIQQGKFDQARADLRAVLAWDEERVGPQSLSLVHKLLLLVDIELRQGRLDEATRPLERALDLLEARPDADPDSLSSALQRRGAIHRQRGDFGPARVDLERGVSLRREDSSMAPVLIELGHLERDLGRDDAAAGHYRRALTLSQPGDPNAEQAREALDAIAADGTK